MAGFGAFLTYLFFFTTGRRKDEADVKYSGLPVNVQIIYIKTHSSVSCGPRSQRATP